MDYTGYWRWKKKTHKRRFNKWYKSNCGKCIIVKPVDKKPKSR